VGESETISTQSASSKAREELARDCLEGVPIVEQDAALFFVLEEVD
jgi:hypothetical protein